MLDLQTLSMLVQAGAEAHEAQAAQAAQPAQAAPDLTNGGTTPVAPDLRTAPWNMANPYAAGAASCSAPNPYAQGTHTVQQIPLTAAAKTGRDSMKPNGYRQPGTWSAPTVGNRKEDDWQTAKTAKYPPKLSTALAIAISESAYLPGRSSTLPAPD